MAKNVFMIPFASGGVPDKSITSNGRDFKVDKLFMLICNHPIGKKEKVYFEFTIKNYKDISSIKYYPLYVGVHKEPASGTLSNDFCLGSVFFSVVSGNYSVLEKHLKTASTKNSDPGMASYRPPATEEIVGVAIDIWDNLITIYVEGKKLYSFSPSLFNMRDEDPFYAAIYSNIQADLVGSVNTGKGGCKYLPAGYITMYDAHNKSISSSTIIGNVYVDKPDRPTVFEEVSGNVQIESIKGDGQVLLEKTNSSDIINNGVSYELTKNGGVIYSSLPIPDTHKIYTELYVRDAVPIFKMLGIPISIGITDKPDSIQNGHSVEIPLHHRMTFAYDYTEHNVSSSNKHVINNVFTSVPNEEGKIIGIGTDLANGLIHVWVDKVLFYSYKITKFKADHGFRLFIRDDGSFTNGAKGYFNFGAAEEFSSEINPFKMDIPDGYISLWHYYNKLIKYPVSGMPSIVGVVEVEDKFTRLTRYITGQVTVDEKDEIKRFRSGLNRLMMTYNVITDIDDPGNPDFNEAHYSANETTFKDHNDLIAAHNDGYHLNNPNDSRRHKRKK